MKNKLIIGQVIFLAAVFAAIYLLYPKINVKISGNIVNFNSINANLIIISENPDFSSPIYLIAEKNTSIDLKPGTYYWKPSNNLIQGIAKKLIIKPENGEEIKNESESLNTENVKINVTKTKEGALVGRIILEPDEE